MTETINYRGQTLRRFEEKDWVGALILCPHCNEKLRVIKAEGPYLGENPNPEFGTPTPGDSRDYWWQLTLEDGYGARMWEHRQGVVLKAEDHPNG